MSDLSPVIGSERSGRRPVVILSGNVMNKFLQPASSDHRSTYFHNQKLSGKSGFRTIKCKWAES
ncbi:type II toxin-antitoxin system PemK/MazF family toxin [Algoriphagus sp.]